MGLFDDLIPEFPPGTITQVVGVVRVTLNGVDYQTKPGAVLEMGGVRRTQQFGNDKRTGASEEPVASRFTCEFLVYGETEIETIRDFKGIAEFITDTGNHLAADNCSLAEPPKIMDAGQGMSVIIEGDPAFEVNAASLAVAALGALGL